MRPVDEPVSDDVVERTGLGEKVEQGLFAADDDGLVVGQQAKELVAPLGDAAMVERDEPSRLDLAAAPERAIEVIQALESDLNHAPMAADPDLDPCSQAIGELPLEPHEIGVATRSRARALHSRRRLSFDLANGPPALQQGGKGGLPLGRVFDSQQRPGMPRRDRST